MSESKANETDMVAQLVEALKLIQATTPRSGLNPHAKVGDPNAVRWNVHLIAERAIAMAEAA